MASYPQPTNIINRVADADLSAQQFTAVKLTATGTVAVAGANEVSVGFLMNKPLTGEVAEIASIGGGAKGISAGTIAAGVLVKADASGHLVAALAGENAVALTLDASVTGDIFAVLPLVHTAA